MDFLSTKKLLRPEDNSRFSDIVFDAYLDTFTEDIMLIYSPYSEQESDQYLQEIIKIPWIFCKIVFSQKQQGYAWAESSYSVFGTTCQRLFEFTLHIHRMNNQCLNDFYLAFEKSEYNDLLDYYFKNINKIENRGFKIKKSQGKNHVDYIDSVCQISIKYPPVGIITALKSISNPLEKFLRYNELIQRIYDGDDSKNFIQGRNPNGQWGEREKYETSDIDFTQALIKKNRDYSSLEEKVEDSAKGDFLSSPLLNSNATKILGFKPASENNQFKRLKIARAISANIGKINQNLRSNYTLPERKLFSQFLHTQILHEKMELESSLFLASLLLAIDYKKLIRVMMGIDDTIMFNLKQGTLTIQLNASIFAKGGKGTEAYAKKIKSTQQIKTQLPENLIALLRTLDRQITDLIRKSARINEEIDIVFERFGIEKKADFQYMHTSSSQFKKAVEAYILQNTDGRTLAELSSTLNTISFLDSFFDHLSNNFSQYLVKKISDFPKRIVLHASKLPHMHKMYLNALNKESCTERLFFSSISRSEEVKMCYTSMPATFTLQENWYLMLQKYLNIDVRLNAMFECKSKIFLENKRDNRSVGSPFFIQPGKAKNFFLSLLNEVNSSHLDDVVKDSIKMVYIRYALSFLLGTRNFHHSCDLGNHCKAYDIISIQEKEKDARSSKRIIPLCKTAKELIDIFHQLKSKYDYHQDTPCLIIMKENKIVFDLMTQNNIISWIDDHHLNIDTDFIKHVPQNYGRHVIKSSKLNSQIKDEFIDAFLNHHSSGTEDQGLYSTFSNRRYMDEIRIFLEDIATEYLPGFGTENLR